MGFFKGLKLILTLKCDESSRLMSERLDRDLTTGERFAIRLHSGICRSCRHFAEQLRVIKTNAPESVSTACDDSSTGLSDDARQRMIDKLRQ